LKEKYEKVSKYMASKGHHKVASIGFCWGVWFAFRMSADYDNILAIAGPHPSLQVEGFYGGTEVKLIENTKCPAFFYVGGNDHANTKKGGELVNILVKRFGDKAGT
jgi:dienelactone hydrolase